MVEINCDGSLKGNPGVAGLGATCRNHTGDFLLVIWRKIGVNKNYLAECLAIVESAEVAVQRNWKKVWFEWDSATTIVAFGTGNMPWSLKNKWHKCKNFFSQCILSSILHSLRGCIDMITEDLFLHEGKPPWIYKWEVAHITYLDLIEFTKVSAYDWWDFRRPT
ncbi:hypothetical protein IFM89_038817 [Coptis chinensis]|uniref:RNase H type-1 domain-containing protein n=1 Tax=Coptis chinensis TaxID=261450 RepID=A0A835LT47_9MAGN|nr:hypothetical protein IFM89_038817 [Coptis chinensis]